MQSQYLMELLQSVKSNNLWGFFLKVMWELIIVIIGFFMLGFSMEEIENKTYPNQGIRESIKNCAKYILSVNLILTVSILILSFAENNIHLFLEFWVPCLFLGIPFGFYYGGGIEVMRHYNLCLGLYQSKKTPWNYTKFLDSCVDRILLQKVGGGYIFIHRMLLEYFADLENKPLPEAS